MFSFQVNLPTIKVLAKPILLISLALFFILFMVRVYLPRLRLISDNISESQKTINTLKERVSVLSSFDASVVDDKTDVMYLVLPDSNPAPIVVYQIRTLANDKGVEFKEVRLAGYTPDEGGNNKVDLDMKFSAQNTASFIEFVESLKNVAPIFLPTSLQINNINGVLESTLKVSVFWSPLPTRLPKLDAPITGLSPEDSKVFERIVDYKFPEFSQNFPQEPYLDRLNPFN
jgi:hypothetical protein